MDIKRVVLYGALALMGYFLWMNWQTDYPQKPVDSAEMRVMPPQSVTNSFTPPVAVGQAENAIPISTESAVEESLSGSRVYVTTDVLNLAIDLKQGDIVNAQLSSYSESADSQSKPITLLQDNPTTQYVANSGLVVMEKQVVKSLNVPYKTEEQNYVLDAGQETLVVSLKGETASGLVVTKTFSFKRGSYLINVAYHLDNQGSDAWTGYLNTQLLRSSPQEDKTSVFHMGSFTGASYSIPGQHRYKKLTFKDMTKANLEVETTGGWIAMQQHYFLTAWIPTATSTQRFYTRASGNDYTIGQVSTAIVVDPQQSQSVQTQLYVGPETTDVLKSIAPGLDLTVDYGWLWFISQILFSVMKAIHSVIGNWGWSIVLVTLMIKLAFFKLQATSFKSMAKMRHLQPKIAALRERHGEDKAKLSQATMELYKQEKVNPLGGCLPILIQIPVFIALYWVLIESVELRHAPFILWITDLAAADPYHVLPIIMGVTMLIQQKLNPAPPDPMQAKVMMFLPVVFTILFLNFPAGLVLYWTVNNSLSILQQWYITRKFGDAATPKNIAHAK
jgi:YidC/Oxa1 family membrane protein insertase